MNWYKLRLRTALILAAVLVTSNALMVFSGTSPIPVAGFSPILLR